MQPAANTEDADRAIADVNDETAVFGNAAARSGEVSEGC